MTCFHACLEVNSSHIYIGSRDRTKISRLAYSGSKYLDPLSRPVGLPNRFCYRREAWSRRRCWPPSLLPCLELLPFLEHLAKVGFGLEQDWSPAWNMRERCGKALTWWVQLGRPNWGAHSPGRHWMLVFSLVSTLLKPVSGRFSPEVTMASIPLVSLTPSPGPRLSHTHSSSLLLCPLQ